MTRCTAPLMLFTTLFGGGCGTLADMLAGPINDQVYYRGVTTDLEVIKEGGLLPLLVLDLPFSALADTVLLPFQAYWQKTGQQAAGENSGESRSLPTAQKQTAKPT